MTRSWNDEIFEAIQARLDAKADEKAGYPPNCNEGYEAKDGKCVLIEKDSEKSGWKKKKKK